MNNSGHSIPFSEIYGKPLAGESKRPGANVPGKLSLTVDQKLYIKKEGCYRLAVNCSSCGKPRAVYSPNSLTTEQTNHVKSYLEQIVYDCGSPLYVSDIVVGNDPAADVVMPSGPALLASIKVCKDCAM